MRANSLQCDVHGASRAVPDVLQRAPLGTNFSIEILDELPEGAQLIDRFRTGPLSLTRQAA